MTECHIRLNEEGLGWNRIGKGELFHNKTKVLFEY